MYRGADVYYTDYYLILVHFREKMSTGRKRKKKLAKKYDVDKLKNKETLRSFQETKNNGKIPKKKRYKKRRTSLRNMESNLSNIDNNNGIRKKTSPILHKERKPKNS